MHLITPRMTLARGAKLPLLAPPYVWDTSAQLSQRRRYGESAESVSLQTPEETTKPFHAIPGPRRKPLPLQVLSYLLSSWKYPNGHDRMADPFRQYGPIYKEPMGKQDYVFTCSVKAVEKLFREDDKMPRRFIGPSWAEWREKNGYTSGILVE